MGRCRNRLPDVDAHKLGLSNYESFINKKRLGEIASHNR